MVPPGNMFVKKNTSGAEMAALNPLLGADVLAAMGNEPKMHASTQPTLHKTLGRKASVISSTFTGEDEDDDFCEEVKKENVLSDSTRSYVPVHYTFKWHDATHEEYCTVVITLPSGVVINGNLDGIINVSLNEKCSCLEYEVVWPEAFTSRKLVMAAVNKFTNNHATLHAVALSLNLQVLELKNKQGEVNYTTLGSVSTISLPFTVEPKIKGIYPMSDSATALHTVVIILKARVEGKQLNKFKMVATDINQNNPEINYHLSTFGKNDNDWSSDDDEADLDRKLHRIFPIVSATKAKKQKFV